MNDAQKFNYFTYPLVQKAMEKQKITVPLLSNLTGISPRTLYYILDDQDNFEKTSYKNIQVIMAALKINEQQVVDDYYRSMYNLGNDDSNVIAILNIVEGSRNFKLSEENFNLIVKLLEKLADKDCNPPYKIDNLDNIWFTALNVSIFKW